MKRSTLFLSALLMMMPPLTTHAMPEEEFESTIADLVLLQEEGRLTDATEKAKNLLEEEAELTAEQRRAIEFEIERARRIRQDYGLTKERLAESLQSESWGIKDFNQQEFEDWIQAGLFDMKMIDGEMRFVNASRANLFFRNPDIRARRARVTESTWQPFLAKHVREVLNQTEANGTAFGERKDMHLDFTITVDANEVPEGDTVRVWMPFPQQFSVQENVRLLSAEPFPKWINRSDYPQRSLYFEVPSNGAEETEVNAKFTMGVLPRYFRVDPARVQSSPEDWTDPAAAYFAQEDPPHVVFTGPMRELEAEIAGGETNPYLRARRYYDWMAGNIDYSYAREYSTLTNISDYVRENRYGDCGQLALMFITLCRIGGIPARWQSGWNVYPMYVGLHDWAEIYIEPYGWIPVDVNYAIELTKRFEYVSEEDRAVMTEFYFGGLDGYRFTANRQHGFPHYPPKEDFRSDTVDFQRGELEANGENLYFDQFGYSLKVTHLN